MNKPYTVLYDAGLKRQFKFVKYDSEYFTSLRAPNGREHNSFFFSYSVLYSTLGISTITIVGHIFEKHDKNHSRYLDWKQNQFLVYDTKGATEFHSTFVWSRVGFFILASICEMFPWKSGRKLMMRLVKPDFPGLNKISINPTGRYVLPVETANISRWPGM